MADIIEFPAERSGTPLQSLVLAEGSQLHVAIERSIPESDDLLGHVVGVSDGWVAVARLSDRVSPDGWTFIPLDDVCSVSVDADPDCFPNRALRARGHWPPKAPDRLELGSVRSAVASAARTSALVTLFRELQNPDTCVIGAAVSLDDDAVGLRLITPEAVWESDTTRYELEHITRVECGGGYEESLHLAVELLPSVPGPSRNAGTI